MPNVRPACAMTALPVGIRSVFSISIKWTAHPVFGFGWAASSLTNGRPPPICPRARMDASSACRRVIPGVALRPGDEIRIEGMRDGGETAGLDYVEIRPDASEGTRFK